MICPPRRLGILVIAAGFLPSAALAGPPRIENVAPCGLQRGVASELNVSGPNMGGNPRLIAPFSFQLAPTAPAGSDGGRAKFALTIAPDTAVGVYPIRIVTDDGVSNPFLFSVGQLPQVGEKEENGGQDVAQVVSAPCVIEGEAAGNDVDFFAFNGRKGERIVIDAACARIGSGVDPTIRLTKRDRTFIAAAEDTPGLETDARIVAALPDDGEYVVELSDARYQGGGRPVYRLLIGAVPAAEELYPLGGRLGDTLGFELRGGSLGEVMRTASLVKADLGFPRTVLRAKGDGPFDVESVPSLVVSESTELRESAIEGAGPVRGALPVVFQGRIDPPGDEDRFTVVLTPNQKKLRIEVEAAAYGSALDGVLRVLNAKGEVIGNADDTPLPDGGRKARPPGLVSPDPMLIFDVPAGLSEITLALNDLAGRGGVGYPYRVKIDTADPDFELNLSDSQVSLPKGGTATLPVTLTRRGWNGPVRVEAINLPAGLTARAATISDGQLVGSITLSAAADASFGLTHLEVIGLAQGPEGPIRDRGAKSVVFAVQGNVPIHEMTFVGLAVAPALELPISLDAPADPIEVAHGGSVAIPIKAVRKSGADGGLGFSVPNPVPGMAITASNFPDKASEGTATVSVTTDHPLGPVSLGLFGKGKIGPGELTVSVPLVTLNVVRPVAVELSAASFEIKAGQMIEVKGKIVRKPGFGEPVTVKLDGLPAGVKSEPVALTPQQTEFALKLTAEPTVAAATVNPALGLAFQAAKKDYPFPAMPIALKVLPPG